MVAERVHGFWGGCQHGLRILLAACICRYPRAWVVRPNSLRQGVYISGGCLGGCLGGRVAGCLGAWVAQERQKADPRAGFNHMKWEARFALHTSTMQLCI